MRADLDRGPVRVCAGGANGEVAQQTHTVTCAPGRLVQPWTGCVLRKTLIKLNPKTTAREIHPTMSIHPTSIT